MSEKPAHAAPSDKESLDAADIAAESEAWTKLAEMICGVDERKIRDCKEDMDAVLVFAGLFSAVLTAFLIESYQNLRQDPTDVIVGLLQQLVTIQSTQSFAINGNTITSTFPPSTTSSTQAFFQPSTNAIRVNVLWFSSLLFGLISASFAILVKQWLREYLADDYTSPQARLRVRNFRYPGLADWKVFEIAAALPLLLQTSLGLFFVGLCFFTADVHNSIGRTTLPLVAGWAFLFFATTFAAVLSPRCPYKTAFLKPTVQYLRRQLTLLVERAQMLYKAAKRQRRNMFPSSPRAAVSTSMDIDILIETDLTHWQSNEHMLPIIWKIARQSTPDEAIRFLYSVIFHRAPPYAGDMSFQLSQLPVRTYEAIMEMVAEILERGLPAHAPHDFPEYGWRRESWLQDCLKILTTEAIHPLGCRANRVLVLYLSNGWLEVLLRFIEQSCTASVALERLQGSLPLLKDKMLPVLLECLQKWYCKRSNTRHRDLVSFFKQHTNLDRQVCTAISRILLDTLEVQGQWAYWQDEHFALILEICAVSDTFRVTIIQGVGLTLVTAQTGEDLWKFVIGPECTTYPSHEVATALLADAVVESGNCTGVLRRIVTSAHDDWRHRQGVTMGKTQSRFDPLRVCLFQLQVLQRLQERGRMQNEDKDSWDTIIRMMSTVLQAVSSSGCCTAKHAETANQCLLLVDKIEPMGFIGVDDDQTNETFTSWARMFNPSDSLFSDSFIYALSEIQKSEDHGLSLRVRRLHHLHQKRILDMNKLADEEDMLCGVGVYYVQQTDNSGGFGYMGMYGSGSPYAYGVPMPSYMGPNFNPLPENSPAPRWYGPPSPRFHGSTLPPGVSRTSSPDFDKDQTQSQSGHQEETDIVLETLGWKETSGEAERTQSNTDFDGGKRASVELEERKMEK